MCGVLGLKILERERFEGPAAELAVALLSRLQHRGQDAAGLTVLSEAGDFQTARGLGLIDHALVGWPELAPGYTAVAHTRYATTGTGGVGEVQPFVNGTPRVALAHNGQIVNTAEIIEKDNLQVATSSDLDVIMQVFLKNMPHGFTSAVQAVFDDFNGAYAVVGMDQDGSFFGFRDPFGIRPLFMASSKSMVAFASETSALSPLQNLDASLKIEEVPPSTWVRVTPEGKIERATLTSKLNKSQKKSFCMFEAVYFSSPTSEMNGESVYRLRFRLGERLAREIQTDISPDNAPRDLFDYVVPVPDTSRTAALAVAETLGVPYREFLVKNPYVPRTFILPGQRQRLKALSQKLSLIGPELRGKRILLVDDSVVRGNTSRMMALRLREAGAKTVTLASTCPPIRHGCFYGIDFPDPTELVAHDRDVKSIAESLGVDGLYYISLKSLKSALDSEKLCTACLTGEYPTPVQPFEKFLRDRRSDREEAKV